MSKLLPGMDNGRIFSSSIKSKIKVMTQTAVELLAEQLRLTHKEAYNDLYEVIEQAKQMFEEQIIEARIDGDEGYSLIGSKRREYAERYYNETFKK